MKKTINDRPPNFRAKNGKLFLVRCYACDKQGKENYGPAVATGICIWCGWPDKKKIKSDKNKEKTRWNMLEFK